MKPYDEFIKSKLFYDISDGFDIEEKDLNPHLSLFQRSCVKWTLKRGRAGLFEGTGLGKTIQGLEWANQIYKKTGGRVLWLSPLCVAKQTVDEASKFEIEGCAYCRWTPEKNNGVNIVVTNYEMIDKFDIDEFSGVVLDESSILKSFSGKIRNNIIDKFRNTPYKLSLSATPSPNDHMELGSQAEFLGIMSANEMLSMFFVHDGGDTSKWRLKKHGQDKFWEWLSTWAIVINKPSDIGFNDEGYDLPKLEIIDHVIESKTENQEQTLFSMPVKSLSESRREQRLTSYERCSEIAGIINNSNEQWIVWCNVNEESDLLCSMIPDALDIKGNYTINRKENRVNSFIDGRLRVLVTKAKMGGYGSNWQHCRNIAHVSITFSFEDFYQTVRRCWRFGQKRDVYVHMVMTDKQKYIRQVIDKKRKQYEEMLLAMAAQMSRLTLEKMNGSSKRNEMEITERECCGNNWKIYNNDCIDVMKNMEDCSIHYSIFSPPFSSLYTYSNSVHDMGNTKSHSEFYEHFEYAVKELYRILKPGRLVSFHCMNIPYMKQKDGFIGLMDFRGDLIRLFCKNKFIFHSEVCIWKDPVVEMQRTKALGLLHKQLKKDSSMSRNGIPDYLITMRKPGDNDEPISHSDNEIPVNIWQKYASPVWMDIRQNNTLNKIEARDNCDEKHICPLQLDVVSRAIELWTNQDDIVFTPFMGIGTEIYQAVKMGRHGIGVELKPKYFDVALKNIEGASKQMVLL